MNLVRSACILKGSQMSMAVYNTIRLQEERKEIQLCHLEPVPCV